MKRIIVTGIICVHLFTACAAAQKVDSASIGDQEVMAVLWQQTSGEYRALCYQAYFLARISFDQWKSNSADKKMLPPAVIVDVDETVLDNSPQDAKKILKGVDYNQAMWDEWSNLARAEAVPGAVEFLKYVSQQGGEVFYITNRGPKEWSNTIANLQKQGCPMADSSHVMPKIDDSNKEKRRQKVAADHTVVLLIGDNLNDHAEVFYKKSAKERCDTVDQLRKNFGTKFIVLPNPMYGDWEGALYDYQKLKANEKKKIRMESLRGY